MSLEADKQATLNFLLDARARIEQAIASFNNGDFVKMKVRLEQHDEAMKTTGVKLGVFEDKQAAIDAAQAAVSLDAP